MDSGDEYHSLRTEFEMITQEIDPTWRNQVSITLKGIDTKLDRLGAMPETVEQVGKSVREIKRNSSIIDKAINMERQIG